MSEECIVRHCSPTLAGLKTANLFSCPCASASELRAELRCLNRRFSAKGLRFLLLKHENCTALVYVYRPVRLKDDLAQTDAGALLMRCGYQCTHPERCIVQLIEKLRNQSDFPHEIGLFLGYPPEDVRGFIENDAKHFKCVGAWKVYGDVSAAQVLFQKYKLCTADYLRRMRCGGTMEQLAVGLQ